MCDVSRTRFHLVAWFVGACFSCANGQPVTTAPSHQGDVPEKDPPALTSLGESIEPLRTRFNENRDVPRFIAVLSPT